MTYRVRNITIAVALALVAALLVSLYVANYQRRVDRNAENVEVYVAARDIPAGTPAEDLVGKGYIVKAEVVRKRVVPGSISQPEQLEGLVAKQAVLEGEQVATRRFSTPAERGVRAELKGNQRAVQVQGDQHQLLAGTLRQGDRVDVVANIKLPGDQDIYVTRIVLRNIRVLKAAPATSTDAKVAAPSRNLSTLLAVTDTQVQKLFFVTKNSDWTLQLRPPANADDSPESVEWAGSLLRDGIRGNQLDGLIGGTP